MLVWTGPRTAHRVSAAPPAPGALTPSEFATRIDAKNLLVDIAAGTDLAGAVGGAIHTPARASVADPKDGYTWGVIGPNADCYDVAADARWRALGGDWRDRTGTRQGTAAPYFQFAANAVGSGANRYQGIDVARAVTDAFRRGRSLEFIVRCTAERSIVSQHHATLPAPVITGTYVDGTPFTLACKACVSLSTFASTAFTQVGAPLAPIGSRNVALGFEFPLMETVSASLAIGVDGHSGTPGVMTGDLIAPPVNTEPIDFGVSAAYEGDVGIALAQDVVLAQNFADGTVLTDYVVPPASTVGMNIFKSNAWNQQLWGGSPNLDLLPTAWGGIPIAGSNRWFHKSNGGALLSLVNSSYTGEGFTPPAPGHGALRIVLPAGAGADGAVVGSGAALDLMTLFPLGLCGYANEIELRFMIMQAWEPPLLQNTRMLRTGPGGRAEYNVPRGKFGIGAHHLTYGAAWGNGGNNNDGGDNLGWSNRPGFWAAPKDSPLAGTRMFHHSSDNRPAHANLPIGKDGGLGAAMFAGVWYDIGVYLRLNDYLATGAVGSSPTNGIVRTSINGRLDSVHTFKWRDGAIDPLLTPNGPDRAPCGTLGALGLWMNFYPGGILPAEFDMTWFVGPIVAAARVAP